MTRVVFSLVLLALVYVAALASAKPGDLLVGALVAGGLLALFRRVVVGQHPAPLPHLGSRLLRFIPFVARVVRDVVAGTWNVALVMVHLRPLRQPGVVAIPIAERTHRGIAVTALLTTLSPGSYFLDVDWEQGVMLFHFLDAGDPDAIRHAAAEFYARYQRHVFP